MHLTLLCHLSKKLHFKGVEPLTFNLENYCSPIELKMCFNANLYLRLNKRKLTQGRYKLELTPRQFLKIASKLKLKKE